VSRRPQAEFAEEINGGIDVLDHEANIVHSLNRHEVLFPVLTVTLFRS
jgi:hypothetical protein